MATNREAIVRFVRDECAGNVKDAAERMGVSVSYILTVAPDLKTPSQLAFDARAHDYLMPSGNARGDRP